MLKFYPKVHRELFYEETKAKPCHNRTSLVEGLDPKVRVPSLFPDGLRHFHQSEKEKLLVRLILRIFDSEFHCQIQ